MPIPAQSPQPIAGHGEILVSAGVFSARRRLAIVTVAVTMSAALMIQKRRGPAIDKFLVKFDLFKFKENSRRIRIDFAQKRRFIANNSFKPVC